MTTLERLQEYIRGGRVHPALLLSGPDPRLKFQAAKNLAKQLMCTQGNQERFCGECSPCRRIQKEVHPDVLILREEGEELIKIDTIRELCHQMEVSPIEGGRKIAVIDECHRMNTASANAFLKTLEEPGANRHFFLLTSQPSALLPTILSRCLQFSFKPGESLPVSEVKSQAQREALVAYLKSPNPPGQVQEWTEKEMAFSFLQTLQAEIRAILNSSHSLPELSRYSSQHLLDSFEAAVELEGRLRSNANYGLLVESYLRRYFPAEL